MYNLLKRLHIKVNKKYLRKFFSELDKVEPDEDEEEDKSYDSEDRISYNNFKKLIHRLMDKPELYDLFKNICDIP